MGAARVVGKGYISWKTTTKEIFQDTGLFDVHPSFQNSTLESFVSHGSGAPDLSIVVNKYHDMVDYIFNKTSWEPGFDNRPACLYLAQTILKDPVTVTPGEYLYSIGGFTVAGAMLEAATNKTFEQLMTEELFEPLGMTGCGFGPTTTSTDQPPAQPWGHLGDSWAAHVVPVPPSPYANVASAMIPDGGLHCNLDSGVSRDLDSASLEHLGADILSPSRGDVAPVDSLGEHSPGGNMPQQHLGQSLLVSQETIESGLRDLGEGVIGGGEDGEGLSVLDGVHQTSSSDSSHQSGGPVICHQSVHQVTLGDEHDAINEVDHTIAGLDISLDHTLAVDSDGVTVVARLAVHIDPETGALGCVQSEVIGGCAAVDIPRDHVVQEDALEKLSVSADSIHNLLGEGGEGSVGRGEDCEGSLASQGVCEAGLDGEVDQSAGSIGGELLHQVPSGLAGLSGEMLLPARLAGAH